MAVHSAGTGSGWLESLDVDQPHGLDYQEFNDLRIGVRKRMAKEHVTFAGTTAGGEHLPGQCGVLLVCDDTADFTALVDATTAPLGSMAYCITHANMWCITATASGGAPDFTIIKLGPLSFCLGADYTWTGGHEFDGSVDFSGAVNYDGSCDMSDVYISGDLTIAGTLKVATDFSLTGDMAIDGTANFGDGVFFAAEVSIDGLLKVDGTATEFGGTEGVALFYDPTSMGAVESATLPNGLIMKMGQVAVGASTTDTTVTFGTAFPSACITVVTTVRQSAGQQMTYSVGVFTISKTSFHFSLTAAANVNGINWVAIGY